MYTPQGGGKPTVMDVYDFKGKGVALSMYNTDEVCTMLLSNPSILMVCIVYHWFCALFLQDGSSEENAAGAFVNDTFLTRPY